MNTLREIASSEKAVADIGRRMKCASCISHCCRQYSIMEINPEDKAFFEAGGTTFEDIEDSERRYAHKPGRGKDFYRLTSDCGYLDQDTGLCTVYDLRPDGCRNGLSEGSFGCGTYAVNFAIRQEAAGQPPVDLGIPMVPARTDVTPAA